MSRGTSPVAAASLPTIFRVYCYKGTHISLTSAKCILRRVDFSIDCPRTRVRNFSTVTSRKLTAESPGAAAAAACARSVKVNESAGVSMTCGRRGGPSAFNARDFSTLACAPAAAPRVRACVRACVMCAQWLGARAARETGAACAAHEVGTRLSFASRTYIYVYACTSRIGDGRCELVDYVVITTASFFVKI